MNDYKVHFDGMSYWVGKVVRDQNGQALHVATVSDNTTNKKLANQWLKRLQAYSTK